MNNNLYNNNNQINILFFLTYLENMLLKKGKYKTLHKKILKLFLQLKMKLTIVRLNIFIRIFYFITPFLKLTILKKRKKEIQKVKYISKIFGTKLGLRWLVDSLTDKGRRYLIYFLFFELLNLFFKKGNIYQKKLLQYQACIKSRFFKY